MMMCRNALAAVTAATLLGACTTPVPKGDSLQNHKQLSFPKVGVQSTAAAGSLAVLHSNYESRFVYRLAQPFQISAALLSKVVVSTDERLVQSELDGRTVYSTESKTYIDPLTGPWAVSCFTSATPGKFGSVSYRPGAIWFSKTLSPEIAFAPYEVQTNGQAAAFKRELVFDGSQGQTLLFSERIYEKSLDTPSRVKPLLAAVTTLPAKVTLDGMELNVFRYDARTVTFEVIHPWQ